MKNQKYGMNFILWYYLPPTITLYIIICIPSDFYEKYYKSLKKPTLTVLMSGNSYNTTQRHNLICQIDLALAAVPCITTSPYAY